MLMLAYGASVGGLLTPVGSPPNLIGRGLIEEATGERISFTQWMLTAIPSAQMFVALSPILLLLNKPEIKRLEGLEQYVAAERKGLGSVGRGAQHADRVRHRRDPVDPARHRRVVAGTDSKAYGRSRERLDEGIVAVLAASLLFLLPTKWANREFTLTWKEAARIDWGTILLFGTGIIFGALLADRPGQDDRHLQRRRASGRAPSRSRSSRCSSRS